MDTEIQALNHESIVKLVSEFLVNKPDGNWHKERIRKADLHAHGADLILVGGKRNSEHFIIECKGKSSALSADSINREGWLHALGQLVTRMDTERIIQCGANKGKVNRAYKYGLGLYWVGAQTALR